MVANIFGQIERRKVLKTLNKMMEAKKLLGAFDAIKDEARRDKVLLKRVDTYRAAQRKRVFEKCFDILHDYHLHRVQVRKNKYAADKLRIRLLKTMHLRALYKFKEMEVVKLENIRKVNRYLEEKR